MVQSIERTRTKPPPFSIPLVFRVIVRSLCGGFNAPAFVGTTLILISRFVMVWELGLRQIVFLEKLLPRIGNWDRA
jgi:hypothetical protein